MNSVLGPIFGRRHQRWAVPVRQSHEWIDAVPVRPLNPFHWVSFDKVRLVCKYLSTRVVRLDLHRPNNVSVQNFWFSNFFWWYILSVRYLELIGITPSVLYKRPHANLLKTRSDVSFGSFSVESGNIFTHWRALHALNWHYLTEIPPMLRAGLRPHKHTWKTWHVSKIL
jgi:hypothetical protein